MVEVGDAAPDFRLPSSTGGEISLAEFKGRKGVVLYFYPKDETQGCTREACGFRDSYEVFKEWGVEVLGVSSDTIDSHRKFAGHHNLSFPLLSDSDGKVRKAYGVSSTLGLFPGRVTYVIDKQGVIRSLFSSQIHPEQHIVQALKAIRENGERP